MKGCSRHVVRVKNFCSVWFSVVYCDGLAAHVAWIVAPKEARQVLTRTS